MYEMFTDRARRCMQLANQEAQRFNHEYIGTEHILLGLLKEGSGTACNVLKNLDVKSEAIIEAVRKMVQPGSMMVTMGKIPQTPRAKKVIEYAMEQAREWNHNYVGTEHVLCGLLREAEGLAGQVLINLGLCLADVQEETLNILGHGMPEKKLEAKAERVANWVSHQVNIAIDDQTERDRNLRIARAKGRIADGQRELAEILLDDERKENTKLKAEIEKLKSAIPERSAT